MHLQFSTNQPFARLELESVRKISEIYEYKKYVAQMHIYWVPETFPSLARNYVRVFGTVTGSRDWRSKAQYKIGQHINSARSFDINNSAFKLAFKLA